MSIRRQMCWSQCLLLLVMMILFCAFLYQVASSYLNGKLEDSVRKEALSIERSFRVDQGRNDWYISVIRDFTEEQFFQITTADGYIIYSSDTDVLGDISGCDKPIGVVTIANGQELKYTQSKITGREPLLEGWNVWVAQSTLPVTEPLGVLLKGCYICGSIIVLVSAVFVYFNTLRRLSPLDKLAERVERMNATTLDYRFATEKLPAELRVIAEKLNQLVGRLSVAMEREKRFSANVTHELRTPIAELRSIMQVGEMWRPEELNEDDPRAYFSDADQVAMRMQSLMKSLLNMVRMDANSLLVEKETVDLYACVVKTVGSHPKVTVCGETCEIFADKSLLVAILENLLSNADRYGEGAIEIELMQHDQYPHLEVRNACRGLTQEDVSHATDPFWRKGSERTSGEGQGLGLSLVNAYSQAHGWELEVALDNLEGEIDSQVFVARLIFKTD